MFEFFELEEGGMEKVRTGGLYSESPPSTTRVCPVM
jgi:hypothetical protein